MPFRRPTTLEGPLVDDADPFLGTSPPQGSALSALPSPFVVKFGGRVYVPDPPEAVLRRWVARRLVVFPGSGLGALGALIAAEAAVAIIRGTMVADVRRRAEAMFRWPR